MPIRVRTGGPADAPAILGLLDGAVAWLVERGHPDQWGTTPWSTSPAAVERIHRYATDYLVRIAEVDGRPAGCCILAEEPPPYAPPVDERELYVRSLVTDRALKGSGVGAALIDDARAETARRGIGLLRVDCYAGNQGRLVAQYQRLGFTPSDTFTVHPAGAGPWHGQVLEQRL
ncbi:GNAT family N-acetyltransferase [Streptacidiphilus griseoplanus]|uniref:GNAT family N-acetyltransferase n=1 Tax=Peterkaempfera griseoplana TaxID=66896 RepID=UPI00099E3F02|nr:GNAT family N-acetyltransferase [Peterkaempfera griseoplana]